MMRAIGLAAAAAVVGLVTGAHQAEAAGAYTSNVVMGSATGTGANSSAGIIAQQMATNVAGSTSNVGTGGVTTGSLSGGGTGESAGSAGFNANVWVNGAVTSLAKHDRGGEFSGKIYTGILGADTKVSDRLTLGLGLGTEALDIRTAFNKGTLTSSSIGFAPYASYVLTDMFAVVGTIGYSHHMYDLTRTAANTTITANTTGERAFNSVDFQARKSIDAWRLLGSLGNLYVYESQDSYAESDHTSQAANQVRLSQARANARVGYDLGQGYANLTPYATTRVEYDWSRTPGSNLGNNVIASADRFGVNFGIGATAQITDRVSFDLGGSTEQFRTNLDLYTVTGTLKIKF